MITFMDNITNKDLKCMLIEGHGEFAGKPHCLQVQGFIDFPKMETKS